MVLVSTGSQGEPMSALSRMANRDHRTIRITENDTVVLASSLIPGNENAVYRVINGLSRWGATVVHKGTAKVHVSGHAPAGELLYVLNATRPSNVMPVHGEWRHLRAHAALAEMTGVPKDRIVLAEDGVVVDLVDGLASIIGAVQAGYVYVDGSTVGEIGEAELKDRLILGDEGFIMIVVVVDSTTGKAHRRARAVRPRVQRGAVRLRRGAPADRRRDRPGRRRGHHRRARPAAPDPAGRRQVGVRHLPPPADAHPGRRRGLTVPGLPLAGETVVVTGDVPHLDRAAAQEAAREMGATVVASVTASCTLVVHGPGAGASKLDKARRRGLRLLEASVFSVLAENPDRWDGRPLGEPAGRSADDDAEVSPVAARRGPVHQLVRTTGAPGGVWTVWASCLCGGWETVVATTTQARTAFREHHDDPDAAPGDLTAER